MKQSQTQFDVIVVGGGHAGVEAAGAAARLGAKTALITFDRANLGMMSCNPAIGGLGKGHLVREVDALDGYMGRCADIAGIQFRLLNRKKGAAVQGPRAQIDRALYRTAVQEAVLETENLTLVEGEVSDLVVAGARVAGVRLADGMELLAGSVVLTTGTFLKGVIHLGDKNWPAGRQGEKPSNLLAERLGALDLPLGRLKTGTPPRLDGRSIDWSAVGLQEGDASPEAFSFLTSRIRNKQVTCGVTRTTDSTHDVVRRNVGRSAMYSGSISGRGPRYCPSIEDKIMRFGDRDGHQIFLEPEGYQSSLIYPNGISTSLPAEVQEDVVHSLPGLERVRIVQPGYAIEYDFVDPRALDPSLELKAMPGLFLAGQINGTTGYEEAAAQGIVAGINATRKAGGQEPVIFDRSQSYIGVMIDDLVTRGVTEPYRMFTSRAEYRLTLRSDNSDRRLTALGHSIGVVGARRAEVFSRREKNIRRGREMLEERTLSPTQGDRFGLELKKDGAMRRGWDLLAYADIDFSALLKIWPELNDINPSVRSALETDAKYSVYEERQRREIEQSRKDRDVVLGEALIYDGMAGLSVEIAQKLTLIRPRTLDQASRIEGMTPAALALVAAHARRNRA